MIRSKARYLLLPIAWLYQLGLSIRHWLYDEHLLPSYRPTIPTICVGNLAVGGTGKTPHTEYLIRLLSSQYRVAVLSRGYGRRTHGFVLADSGSLASTIGDEPMQMHLHFPHVPVAVCEDRVRGIKRLQQLYPDLDVILLDDAYQHRRIRCGLNIVLTEHDNLYCYDYPLPVGRLRDLRQRILGADIVVVTKCPADMSPIDRRVVSNKIRLAAFQTLVFSSYGYPPLPAEGNPLIVTGIANPAPLMAYVRRTCPNAGHLAYADHHRFTQRDVNVILSEAEHYDYVLTTEKDKVRLDEIYLSETLGSKMQLLPIEVHIDSEFDRKILSYIAEKKRKHEYH